MIRATRVLAAGQWSGRAADTITLDHDQRHRRRVAMTGDGGTALLLDLAEAVPLRDGDGIVLEDGRIVSVTSAAEPLAEIVPHNPAELARVAWHLGNRHLPCQLVGGRIRIRRDHVIEDMVVGLGAHVSHVLAPFDPESGAYHGGGHHHHGDHNHHNPALDHDDRLDDDAV